MAAVSLYDALNKELERLHELIFRMGKSSSDAETKAENTAAVWKRITAIQDAMMEAVKGHDAAIQEKVAEMALMGKD